MVERGEFSDAGENLTEDFGAWMGAGEFERFFMEHLADRVLDAWLLGEIAEVVHIVNCVEDFLGAQDFIHTSPVSAEPTKAGGVNLYAETFRRRGGHFVDDRHERHVLVQPFEELSLLLGFEASIEGIGALLALDG